MKYTITLEFQDNNDLQNFTKYAKMAKDQNGTVTGLYCGLMCSALKRSNLLKDSSLLKACKGLIDLIDRGLLVRDTTGDTDPRWAIKQLPLFNTIRMAQEAINEAENSDSLDRR